MKTFETTFNTRALDVTVEALHGLEGRAKLAAVHTLVDAVMREAYARGHEDAAKLDQAKLEQLTFDAEARGFERGFECGVAEGPSPSNPDDWAQRLHGAQMEAEGRLEGSAKAIADEFTLQRDSGDETVW
jgi:hypothetical protein